MYKAVTYIDRDEAKWLLSGWGQMVSDDEEEIQNGERGDELMKVRAVANAVVKRVHELDIDEPVMQLSPERDGRGFELGDTYPAHGIIVVDQKSTADDIETYLNKKFEQDRSRFPRAKGWRAMATYSGSKLPFDKDHPFFHYKETCRMSQNASRILIVVDRATEGMNNKYLTVMGIAKRAGSILEMVQRIGRLIRSAHYTKDGKMYAPPVAFDMVHLITHSGFMGNRDTIDSAMGFMRNMAGALNDMVDIETYSTMGIDVDDMDENYTPRLTYEEELVILDVVGEAIIQGKRLMMKRIHDRIATKKSAKRELVHKVARMIYERNKGATETVISDIFKKNLPNSLADVIVDDKVHIDPLTMSEAQDWVRVKGLDKIYSLTDMGTEKWLEAVQQVHRVVEGQYYAGDMATSQTAIATLDEIATNVMLLLRLPGTKREVVMHFVHIAALDRLSGIGATIERLENDLNIPSVIAELREPKWRSGVTKWVLWKLYEDGYLPNLKPFVELATAA